MIYFGNNDTIWREIYVPHCVTGICCMFLFDNKRPPRGKKKKKTRPKPTKKVILLTAIVYVCNQSLISYSSELHCGPKPIKSTSVRHTVAHSDMSLHYHEHTHILIHPSALYCCCCNAQFRTTAENSP